MEGGNSSNKRNYTMMNIFNIPKRNASSPLHRSSNNHQLANNASGLPRAALGRPPLPPSSPAAQYREQDRYMPIANITRLMRSIIPPHAKIAEEAKETMQECVSEFICFITEEANDKCHIDKRKTITADDILFAMKRLGFDNYVETLTLYLKRYRQMEAAGYHPRGQWMRPSLVDPTVMVSPFAVGSNPHAGPGSGFGTSHGLPSLGFTTTAATTAHDQGFHIIESREFKDESSSNMEFEVGSCSNNDVFGFDGFDVPPNFVASPSGSASNSTYMGGADQEEESFDPFALFK